MTLNQHFNVFLKNNKNNEHAAMIEMADYIFKNCCLQAGDTPYWFTEIEFYYYSPEHPDPFCKRNPHRAQDTKSPGVASDKLFFHYSGVDISFDSDEADKMKRQYGGILIRGIQNPNEKDAVSGPLKVLCHLLNKTQQTKEGRLTLQLAPSPFTDTYKSIPRYGLSAPAGDEAKQKYIAKPYRFHLSRATGVKQAKTGKNKYMLSKSQYTKYKGCPKHLWLYRNKKEVLTPPDEATQKKLARGQDIGLLAQKQFPGGVAVQDGWKNPSAAVAQTRGLMARGVPAIYEAAFLYNGIFVLVDILEKTPTGWNIVEVKSSGKNLKAIYVDDVSIQNYVVSNCGVAVEHCYLMHINTDYFQTTQEPDWKQFFLLTLLDPELTPIKEIEQDIQDIKALLAAPEPQALLDKSGCAGCEAYAYCWRDVPKDSVFEVFRSNAAREYMALGILRVQDVPPDSCNTDKLNHWVEVYRTQRPYIDRTAVAQWLNKLEYPLYYFDFETTQPVIPLWPYSRPYQQIPFQFSLHIQRKPNGPFEHYEYLFEGKEDPRYGCVEAMLKYIGANGTLIAHHATFEKTRIREMANDLPIPQEQKDALLRMSERFMDTETPFKQDYLHPNMHGSSSIKKVLPSLVPEMTYEGMPVANGGDAMNAFDELYFGNLPEEEAKQLRRDLLAYCKQDTWAMVKLVDALRDSLAE